MYLTYEEYTQLYNGTLDKPTFDDYNFTAQTEIDAHTFGRLKNDTAFGENVKRCVYKIIGILYKKDQAIDNVDVGISSQSNDGVSVSYNNISAEKQLNLYEQEIVNVIKKYLRGVENESGILLLYRGIVRTEDYVE